MLVYLDRELCAYSVTPINKRNKSKGLFVQTDWDFPSLARSFGWNGKIGRERCAHRSTDGTVDCAECGRKAGEFIGAAANFLDSRLGVCRVSDELLESC